MRQRDDEGGIDDVLPTVSQEIDAFDPSLFPIGTVQPVESDQSAGVIQGLRRVAAPGPGDDIGVMVVYTDGMARFESMSGRVIWLTSDERTCGWVC